MTKSNLIGEFVEPEIISAVEKIKDVADVQEVNSLAVTISRLFNAEKIFAEIHIIVEFCKIFLLGPKVKLFCLCNFNIIQMFLKIIIQKSQKF